MTKTEKYVNEMVEMVQTAIRFSEQAAEAIKARDLALDRLKMKVGGDRLAAIRNGQLRIGYLMTQDDADA
jgi:hypothetical protein